MEKVKETFGSNVFESSIRYNIRLRETVDHGLPIGDYDKHAIGYRDYENLAEEVLRADAVSDDPEQPIVETARDILLNTEEYIHSLKESHEEKMNQEETSAGATYQCAPSPDETGESYASNGPGEGSDEER